MRLWLQDLNNGQCAHLDIDALRAAGHEVVEDRRRAQVAIGCATVPREVDRRNVIMLYTEPPLGTGYSAVYKSAGTFRAFGSLVDLGCPRCFPLTLDPIAYPYGAQTYRDKLRLDTTLSRRRVFYAGTRRGFPKGGDGDYGRVALYGVRNGVVDGLRSSGVDVYAEGVGWNISTRRLPNWDAIKGWRVEQVGADFHLCMENSQLPNYISEKIHHGFQSDRVVLYLGCSRIHEHVPAGAFINLNTYFGPRTKAIRLEEVARLLREMTQERYDRIIFTAREWRRTDLLEERFVAERARVTAEVLRFL